MIYYPTKPTQVVCLNSLSLNGENSYLTEKEIYKLHDYKYCSCGELLINVGIHAKANNSKNIECCHDNLTKANEFVYFTAKRFRMCDYMFGEITAQIFEEIINLTINK